MMERLQEMSNAQAAIIGLVISFFYWWLLFEDGRSFKVVIEQSTNDIAMAKSEIMKVETTMNQAREFRETVQALGDQLTTLTAYVPEKLSATDIMKGISAEAKASGLNILRIQEDSVGRPPGQGSQLYETLQVDVELQGTFPQQMLFFSYLTRLNFIVTIGKFEMTAQTNGETGMYSSPPVSLHGKVTGYRYLGESLTPGQIFPGGGTQ